jgi:excisionase family DNA binding protein
MTRDEKRPFLLTPRQVADVLNESMATTYRRLSRGELLTVRLSGDTGPLRVPRGEVEQFLSRRTNAMKGTTHVVD